MLVMRVWLQPSGVSSQCQDDLKPSLGDSFDRYCTLKSKVLLRGGVCGLGTVSDDEGGGDDRR